MTKPRRPLSPSRHASRAPTLPSWMPAQEVPRRAPIVPASCAYPYRRRAPEDPERYLRKAFESIPTTKLPLSRRDGLRRLHLHIVACYDTYLDSC
ncbi:hypothetical protein Esti_003100 [Eimeria stiedai]